MSTPLPPPPGVPMPPPALYVKPRRRHHPFRGLIAGFLLGLGVILLLIVYGWAPWTSGTPYLVLLGLFVLIGLGVGLFGPSRKIKP